MGLQIKLLVMSVFLLLALSFSVATNATVTVVGLINTDCIKNQTTSSNATSGLNVFIICKARKSEMKTQGNGAINKDGKFSVTLSSAAEDLSSIGGCYAKLQSKSASPCPIQTNQTAVVTVQSNNGAKTVMKKSTRINFSPITCQSAFFWPFGPFPNFTFFASPPPPPEYTPPPPEDDYDLPPLGSPVQPPLPPPEDSPEPSYDPPEFDAPSPSPGLSSGSLPPLPPPVQSPNPLPQASPPLPVYADPSSPLLPPQAPPVADPIQTPPSYTPKQTPPPTPTPTPALSAPPAPSAGISRPPSRRKPSQIPRAPPIPRLPRTPSAPRKYFNAPSSKSKPPRFT